MNQDLKLPHGHRVVKIHESANGETIVLAKVSAKLCAVYRVLPYGFADDPVFAPRRRANGIFQAKLQAA
jgi:hypothetical protein